MIQVNLTILYSLYCIVYTTLFMSYIFGKKWLHSWIFRLKITKMYFHLFVCFYAVENELVKKVSVLLSFKDQMVCDRKTWIQIILLTWISFKSLYQQLLMRVSSWDDKKINSNKDIFLGPKKLDKDNVCGIRYGMSAFTFSSDLNYNDLI